MSVAPFSYYTVDAAGNIQASVEYTVRDAEGNLATIYTQAGATITQPGGSDANGLILFYAKPGSYTLTTGAGASLASKKIHVGAIVMPTVTALLADTGIAYSASGYEVPAVAGAVVQTAADGHSYIVAASGATDHDVTTAGGVKLYVQRGADGVYSALAFGAKGDGATDDRAALQAAIDRAEGGELSLRGGASSYEISGPLFAKSAIRITGAGQTTTKIVLTATTGDDGIVLGYRATYANEATFLAAIAGLDDGWYLIGSTDLRKVVGGAQVATATRNLTTETANAGYSLSGFRIDGNSVTEARNLIVCDNLWRADLDNVRAQTCGGSGMVFNNCLHVEVDGCRTQDTVSHGMDATAGINTTIAVRSSYVRTTHNGAGIKSNCLGLTLDSVICEGIGGGSGSDIYAPGIWLSGGNAVVIDPYFEDVRGHNIFIDDTVATLVGGQNGAGAGADQAQYAAVSINGSSVVTLAGAGYASGGGNKRDVKISTALTGQVFGATRDAPIVMGQDITDPTDYTAATYDEANLTAIQALTGMSSGETAHARDTGYEYSYNGAAWVLLKPLAFPGNVVARRASDAAILPHGNNIRLRIGAGAGELTYLQPYDFNANAAVDNVANLQSGASIAAHSSASGTFTLPETIPGYAGSTAAFFSALFSGNDLGGSFSCRAVIANAATIRIYVYNHSTTTQNLPADVKGLVTIVAGARVS